MAHGLTRSALNLSSEQIWIEESPHLIVSLLLADVQALPLVHSENKKKSFTSLKCFAIISCLSDNLSN